MARPLKRSFFTLEISAKSRGQQTFAEPPRTQQEVLRPLCCQLVNQSRLVHIEIPLCTEFFEGLNPDGQFTECVPVFRIAISTGSFHLAARQILLSAEQSRRCGGSRRDADGHYAKEFITRTLPPLTFRPRAIDFEFFFLLNPPDRNLHQERLFLQNGSTIYEKNLPKKSNPS